MSTLAVVVALIFTVNLYVWLVAWLISDWAAKGTHLRFVCRSVRGFTQWPTLLFYLVSTPMQFMDQDWFWGSVYILATFICISSIREYFKDDEDDIWKRGKKKLKKAWRKARENLRVRRPVLAGGFA